MPSLAQAAIANFRWARPPAPVREPIAQPIAQSAPPPYTGLTGMPVRGAPPVGLALDSDLTQSVGIGQMFQGALRSRVYVPATPPWIIKNISIWPSTV